MPDSLSPKTARGAATHRRLIDAARADSPGGAREWGISTECGMGRAGRDEMPVLLDLHRQILAGG